MTIPGPRPTELGEPLTWEPPGPGQWMLDTTHHGRRPVTGYLRALAEESFGQVSVMFERYGLPLQDMASAEVNGCTYIRPRAVGEGDSPKPAPPALVLSVVSRIHPELRRRNRAAKAAWNDKLWRSEVDRWFDHDRPAVVAANRRFAAVAIEQLDDRGLLTHLVDLTAHARRQAFAGFESHGGDMIPVGDYLAHCADWGIPAGEAAALLQGASPASLATGTSLPAVAGALAGLDRAPRSLDELRALGPECRAEVDEWLDTFGWRVISSDDLDAVTLAERPELQLPAILAAASVAVPDPPDPGPVRRRVPADQRALFDELLAEARYGLPLRDDNVGVRWNWSVGLVRRALLEVGRRLVDAGRLHRPEHAVELAPDEVEPLLLSGRGPSADAVAERLRWRLAVEAAGPPTHLGEPEPPPPFDALPRPLARAARAVMALIEAMEGAPPAAPPAEPDGGSAPVRGSGAATGDEAAAVSAPGGTDGRASSDGAVVGRGTGIGAAPVEGTVRVVTGAADALGRIEAGDILVAAFTGPAYNALLPLLGGLVVEEGGPLCHAAIVAREFGLPALVGVEGITTRLADGERVGLDPVAGTISRLG